MQIKLLSVIVPIYKKEKSIQKDLINIFNTLQDTPYNFEIIGVVDGTELDKSFETAKEIENSKIKIYGYKHNKGKGQAVRFGMQKAKGDIISFIDSGMDINPAGIIMLLEHMKWYDADIIVGSKSHPASIVNYPFTRRLMSKIYYYFVKFLFGLRLRDTQTGLKAYKREVLDQVLDRLVVKRFAFDIEILAVANQLGFNKIYDAPVHVNLNYSNSTIFGLFTDNGVWNFIHDTLAIWYRMYILQYYKDGRKRIKEFDNDLKMDVNTGNMTDKRQILIDLMNKIFGILRLNPYGKK